MSVMIMARSTNCLSLVHMLAAIFTLLSPSTRSASAQYPTATANFNTTTELMYLSVKHGKLQMTCNVAHLPSTDSVLSYEWMRKYEGYSTQLPAELSYTGTQSQNLVITMFSALYHSGDYHCQAWTKAGRLLTSNTLQLRTKFIEVFAAHQQQCIEVLEDDPVQLDCLVMKPPNINYTTTWYKKLISLRVVQAEVNGYSPFRLEHVRPEDEGTYVCFVSSSTAGSNEIQLELKIVALGIFRQPESHMTLSIGQNLSLTCGDVSSTGIVTLSWLFNGHPISLYSKMRVEGDHATLFTLTVLNLTYADAGNYTCMATNLAGNSSQDNSIQVTGPPQVLGTSGIVDVLLHADVLLDCPFIAHPAPTATTWRRGGNELLFTMATRHYYEMLPNGSLAIHNVTIIDDYSCEVTNENGYDSIRFTLLLIYVPGQPTDLTAIVVIHDPRSVQFSWTLPEELPSKPLDGFLLELWRNDMNSEDAMKFNYAPNVTGVMIRNLLPGELYRANLYSYNRAGYSEFGSTTLVQLSVTAPGLALVVEALSDGRSLAVKWRLLFDGGHDVELFTFKVYQVKELRVPVYWVEPDMDDQEHTITNLHPTTLYAITITIANSLKKMTIERHVNTTMAPPGQPSTVDITLVTTQHMELSFSVLEGSYPITHFLLNTTSLTASNISSLPSQKMIAIDDQLYVESLHREDGMEKKLRVQLVILDLRSSTSYSFQVAAISAVGVGEFSEATEPTQLDRIMYSLVASIVGGVAMVVSMVSIIVGILVCRTRVQKSKRTIAINRNVTALKPSFVSQNPPVRKLSSGDIPCSSNASSLTNSCLHDGSAPMASDFHHQVMVHNRQYTNRSPSYDKLSISHTGAESLTGESYCSVSMEKRPSIVQSEAMLATNGIPSSCNQQQSHLYSHCRTGKSVPSFNNLVYLRRQLSLRDQLGIAYGKQQQQQRQAGTGHTPLLHQTSVDQHMEHSIMSLSTATRSSSAPAVNVKPSYISILESATPLHQASCITDV